MTTLFWIPAPTNFSDDESMRNQRVVIEEEDAVLSPEQKKTLGKFDGLRGGPPDNKGDYVPITPEHAKELRALAESK